MRVSFVLPSLEAYGGVISVMQLSEGLYLRGFDVAIISLASIENVTQDFIFPVLNMEEARMMASSGPSIFVATRWDTVEKCFELADLHKDKIFYFVQDYEPYFHKYASQEFFMSEESYRSGVQLICKSSWLKGLLLPFTDKIKVIPLGLDLSLFYPDASNEKNWDVVMMDRRSSQRRNTLFGLEVYKNLRRISPGIKLATYGTVSGTAGNFVHELGRLSQSEVGKLLRSSKLVIDPSNWQGFGRPGIEAMACGAVPIQTIYGGVAEYSRHRVNSVLLEPNNPLDWAKEILYLLENDNVRETMSKAAVIEAKKFNLEYELDSWEKIFADGQ